MGSPQHPRALALIQEIAQDGKAFSETGDDAVRQNLIAKAMEFAMALESPRETLKRIGWVEVSRFILLLYTQAQRRAREGLNMTCNQPIAHAKCRSASCC
jgi:hypothetical protein